MRSYLYAANRRPDYHYGSEEGSDTSWLPGGGCILGRERQREENEKHVPKLHQGDDQQW